MDTAALRYEVLFYFILFMTHSTYEKLETSGVLFSRFSQEKLGAYASKS